MSFGGFGVSVGDVVALGTLAWSVYKACKSASAEFEEAALQVATLHTIIKELEDESRNPDSVLQRTDNPKKLELDEIVKNCSNVLKQLEKLLHKYKSLGTKSRRVWDRIKFGSAGLQDVREKLTFHTSAINLFLTTLGTSTLGRIEKKLEEIVVEIRSGRREPTVLTATDDDHEEAESAWNTLKSELLDDGFTKHDLEAHKKWIKAYLHDLSQRGQLQEVGGQNAIAHSKVDPAPLESYAVADTNGTISKPGKYSVATDVSSKQHEQAEKAPLRLQTQFSDAKPSATYHARNLPQPVQLSSGYSYSHPAATASTSFSAFSTPPETGSGLTLGTSPQVSPPPWTLQGLSSPACFLPSLSPLPHPSMFSNPFNLPNTASSVEPLSTMSKFSYQNPYPQYMGTLPSLKRPASAVVDEYQEDVTEYDESGRIRKRTIVRHSSSPDILPYSNYNPSPGLAQPLAPSPVDSAPLVHGNTNPLGSSPFGLNTDIIDSMNRKTQARNESFERFRKLRTERRATLKAAEKERNELHELLKVAAEENQKALQQLSSEKTEVELRISHLAEDLDSMSENLMAAQHQIQDLQKSLCFYREERNYFKAIVAGNLDSAQLVQRRPCSPVFVTRGLRIESPTPVAPSGRLKEMIRREDESSDLREDELMDGIQSAEEECCT